jgi:ferric-dicitrate binding protein FerR (iron transport regulator)
MSKRFLAITIAGLVLAALLALLLRDRFEQVRPVLARLTEVRGPAVERDFAARQGSWSATKPGAEFVLGDGLRTGAQTTAKLQLADASQLSVMPNTTLRFSSDGDAGDGLAIDLQSGEAVIRASKDLRLHTHVGLAMIEAGTLVTLTRMGEGMGFAVQLGGVHFQDGRQIGRGEQLQLGIGMAIVEQQGKPERPRVMLEVKGAGARLRLPKTRSWRDLPIGSQEATPGSELRLPTGSEAAVTRGQDRADLRGAGDYVIASGDALVEARSGEMSLESSEADVEVRVPGGMIVVRSQNGGGRAQVKLGPEQGELKVVAGGALATLNGQSEELTAGATRSWSTAEERQSAQDDDNGPDYFNLSAPAGESFVLHAPELPVAVAFEFGSKCPGEAEIELLGKRQKSRGKGGANLLLSAGTRSYTVRCLSASGAPGRTVARGTVHVLQDAGTRKLPPVPPTSHVEADGRTYTVYYPNQLPDISIRWPNPPQQSSYVLEVDGKPQDVSEPEYVFKSGGLRDGTHQISFRAGTRRSRTTTIEVRFDNNAPTASLNQPADRGFSAGQEVKVEGVSLQAWKVSLEGGTISKESDGRFSGSITPTAGHPDITVRLSHPRLGIHYYLRRAASSP